MLTFSSTTSEHELMDSWTHGLERKEKNKRKKHERQPAIVIPRHRGERGATKATKGKKVKKKKGKKK